MMLGEQRGLGDVRRGFADLRLVRLIGVLTIVVLVLSVGRGPVPAEQHVLRFADGMDVGTLNPWYATTANVTRLSELTMAKFSRFDRNARLVPELVTDIPSIENSGIRKDGTQVTWHLRRNVRWSDGAAFDARDVLFTIAAVKNPTNAFATQGAVENITRASADGPYTVIMTLKHPDSEIGELFGTYGLECILPRHLLAALPSLKTASYNALPVGIGPFRYTRFERGSSVVMEANPYYFRGRPKLDRIEYRMIADANTLAVQLRTGEIDMWPGVGSFADRLRRQTGLTVTRHPGPAIDWIEFNLQRTIVADRNVRRALRLGLDRMSLLSKVLHGFGTVTDSALPPMRPDASVVPMLPFNTAEAERQLDAAGWRNGIDGVRAKDGRPLRLRLIAQSGSPAASMLVELIRDAWQRIGVGVDVQVFSIAQYFAPREDGGPISSGNFDVAIAGGDPYGPHSLAVFFGCASAPPHGLNDSRYCNPLVDAGIARASTYSDVARRKAALGAVQAQIAGDVPLIFAYRRDDVVVYGRRVMNFTPTALTFLDDMMNVDVQNEQTAHGRTVQRR